MKKFSLSLITLLAILFTACSGSDTYRGSWKAMDVEGKKLEIVFDAKSFAVKDSAGNSKNYEYSQNSVSVENSIRSYGIQLADGRNYRVHFPKANDCSVGIIKDENGQLLFTIARDKHVAYNDIYKLE